MTGIFMGANGEFRIEGEANAERFPLKKRMKHLVLGSEGQVGKYVCDEIEANGDEAIRWDVVLDEGHDLRQPRPYDNLELLTAFETADFVHFLAYDVGGSKYLAANQNSFEYIDNNVKIMNNVFGLLKMYEKPFYFASSQMSNMYHSPYGRLKAVGEAYTEALGGLNVHFWNVYGYESDPEKTHVITDFIKMAIKEGRILCGTDGSEVRNFTHGVDAAKMLYALTQHYSEFDSKQPLPIISSPYRFHSIKTVAQYIDELLGGEVELFFKSEVFDTVQGVKNDPDEHLHSRTMRKLFPALHPEAALITSNSNGTVESLSGSTITTATTANITWGSGVSLKRRNPFQFENLKDGIADIIERIKAEG